MSVTNQRHKFNYVSKSRYTRNSGASSSLVSWGTILQAGRSLARFPMRSLDISTEIKSSSHTTALGSTQPLTEMSTRNLPGR
jgi:hypothetical protein